MLLVSNLSNTKICNKASEMSETLTYGTHLRLLSESYPMNTNMIAGVRLRQETEEDRRAIVPQNFIAR